MKPVPMIRDVTSIISVLAVGTTILQFLSGTLVCKQYVTNKTTAEASALPFLCGVLSCGLWLLYGLTINDDTIVLVNTIGIILMTIYTIVFYIYTFRKSSLIKQVSLIIGLLMLTTGYVSVETDTFQLINRLGLLACSLTLVTIAAPMSKLFYVLKVKNTECLPFPMIMMSFFVSLLWFLYGIFAKDQYLIYWSDLKHKSKTRLAKRRRDALGTGGGPSSQDDLSEVDKKVLAIIGEQAVFGDSAHRVPILPNAIGAVLAVSQLSLFFIYPRRPPSPSSSKSFLT